MQDALLVIHFLGLALGVGTSFAMARLARATSSLTPADRGQVMKYGLQLSKNGSIGLGLLILSGLGMLFTRGASSVFAAGGVAFHVKLTLVLILAGFLGYSQSLIKRIREKQDMAAAATMTKVGPVMLILGVGIVICAVLAFH
jgi:uncharacterized membrane protein